MATPSEGSDDLPDLVQRFRVCWEVWSQNTNVEDHCRQTGLVVELSGTHETGVEHATPGCLHCQKVYSALRKVAEDILPRGDRPSVYELAGFDHAIHYSPSRNDRADIVLAISILHKGNLEDPVGECQERCLQDMKRRLKEVGACERRWTSHR